MRVLVCIEMSRPNACFEDLLDLRTQFLIQFSLRNGETLQKFGQACGKRTSAGQ